MRCPECGSEIGDQMAFCPGCGRQVRASPHRSGYVAPAHAPAARRRVSEKRVLPFVAIIVVLVVLLPLLLLMMLFVGVIGVDGPDSEHVTTELTVSSAENGYKFTFGPFTSKTEWGDIAMVLSGASSSASWSPTTAALQGTPPTVFSFSHMSLGEIVVFCNVTDLDGDGWIDEDDFFTVETGGEATFSSGIEYMLLILDERTGTLAASASFSGTS